MIHDDGTAVSMGESYHAHLLSLGPGVYPRLDHSASQVHLLFFFGALSRIASLLLSQLRLHALMHVP